MTPAGRKRLTPAPNRVRALIYVSSYPTGANVTPDGFPDFGGRRCTIPRQRISIVAIPDDAPENAFVLKEQPLHADTLPFLGNIGVGGTGAVGCHDTTVLHNFNIIPTNEGYYGIASANFGGTSVFELHGRRHAPAVSGAPHARHPSTRGSRRGLRHVSAPSGPRSGPRG